MKRLREIKNWQRIISIAAGTVVAIGVGLLCLLYSFANSLVLLSYDLPFTLRGTLNTDEIVIVYLDEFSAKLLNQPLDSTWNRALHVPLLDRLTADGARLVFYDIVFDGPAEEPEADVAFEQSIQRNGKVVLGGALDIARQGTVIQERISAPIRPLRKAAAGWGVLAFRPIDADYGVRQIFTGTSTVPAATWKAAELLGAPATREQRETPAPRWINYCGPPDDPRHPDRPKTFASVSIAQALQPDGVPPGYFKDKVVMIGGRSAVGAQARGLDQFSTPYSRWTLLTPGLEIHANILLNLLHHEWLTRLAEKWEIIIVIAAGLLAGTLGMLRPTFTLLVAIAALAVIAAAACWFQWNDRIWFAWMVPVAVQLPLGIAWSVGSQYLLESRRRKELRKAFGFYLSPEMADRIADSDFDLKPGGKIADVSVIFTDLENFTTLAEKLDPTETADILTAYFGQTTKWILENRGTIIKYIGDAVFAAWGAPIDEPQHAIRAAETACDLRRLTELEVRGKKLRTRIGIHSGRVVAGNLGSAYRFDYTMIGDPVNFASRLESLNKYLKTQVLISDAVRRQLGDGFTTRLMGEFKVAGKTESVVIHELLCRRGQQNGEAEWIGTFEEGLQVFRAGDFDRAADLMNRTRDIRGGKDGPSEFYLRKIETLRTQKRDDWDGIVELTEK